MQEPTQAFARMWKAAGVHIENRAGEEFRGWLKAQLHPPFLEHLSFRLGNQLFFVRVVDVDNQVEGPGGIRGLQRIASGCQGHACLLPMKKGLSGWATATSGWGLLDTVTQRPVDPVACITDELIPMTDWELQDFAVQVVRQSLEKDGHELMSWAGDPGIDPSIWFVGPHGPEWVVVRAARYPDEEPPRPRNWDGIAQHCSRMSRRGNFAAVGVACVEGLTGKVPGEGSTLFRGYGMHVRYLGLQSA
jgi:hypothetical protein